MAKKILITGGAGFIGINASARVLKDKNKLVIVDNLSRKGGKENLEWLKQFGGYEFIECDITNFNRLNKTIRKHRDIDALLHLAGQVAVTTSITDPRNDFESNALGTFNVLETVRLNKIRPVIIYSSTNKVYGGMEDISVIEDETRYRYRDYPNGVPESMNLDFHSPYGCSKGAADQYVRDYARIYDLPAIVLRQSCIYGPRQFGIEDQGWVAWFIIAAVLGKLTSIYGNGKQVRDLLFIDDLVDAYMLIIESPQNVGGKIFNIGGGINNSLSIWKEFGPKLESLIGKKIPITNKEWRQGDQPIYVSDISAINQALGWAPKVNPDEGIKKLYHWVVENKSIIEQALA